MIFIKTNQDNVIELYHYMPFDKDNGLGKTRDELLSIGYLVDSVPDIESIDGKAAVVKYINDDFKVEYVDVKKSEVELLKDKVQQQEQAIFELAEIIAGTVNQ